MNLEMGEIVEVLCVEYNCGQNMECAKDRAKALKCMYSEKLRELIGLIE